jgi:catechol 2,3-dioxygenase-like lactoylglutathione lyase family enzyme
VPTIAYGGLSHLALVTDDMDKTVRFYRDVLGMPLVVTTQTHGEHASRHYFFSIGNGCIAFFEWPDAELPPRKDSGVPGTGRQFDHVSIAVGSDADLEALRERLAGVGADVSEVVDHSVARSVYVTDPNGISLEFSVVVRDLDAEPWFADGDPVPAVLEPTEEETDSDTHLVDVSRGRTDD